MMRSKRGNQIAARRAAGRAVLALGLGLLGTLLVAALALGTLGLFGSQAMAQGTIIYVDVDATGDNNGSSWQDAFTDLQLALDAAPTGDEIWVAAGAYYPSVEHGGSGDQYKSFQMLNGVGIYGGFDPSVGDTDWEDRDWVANETILSGDIGVPGDIYDNCYHVFYHPSGTDLDSSAILDGFTITAGYAQGSGNSGGGMYNVGSSPTLTNCTFSYNYVDYYGGGMHNSSSSPTLSNCTFKDNWASFGGGMCNKNHSSPTLTNCTFEDNESWWNGGGMHNSNSSPTLTNCTFSGNTGYETGGGMYNEDYASPTLTNCTFEANRAILGGGMYNYASSPTLINCILWGNDDEIVDWDSSPVVTNSDIQGGYPGEGNIDADPLWVDPQNGDYHLQPCSPAIDAGDNDAPNLPLYDFEGDDRVFNGTVDMGVDETDFLPPTTYDLTVSSTEGGSVTEPGEGTFTYDCGRVVPLVAVPDYGYSFTVWTGDPVADPNDPSTTITMDGDKTVSANFAAYNLYVDADATGANDGTSWEDAFTDLQAALDAAVPGTDIWVAAGTYYPSVEHGGSGDRYKSFQMLNEVGIYGGFDPSVGDTGSEDRDWVNNVTILSGDIGVPGDDADNCYHVFYHPSGTDLDSSAILDGFAITGGNADGDFPHNSGGGMFNDDCSPTLTNCIFEGNSGSWGAGMFNESGSSPTLTNCAFEGNSATHGGGGGMYNEESSPLLTNCTFEGNSASAHGGGMYMFSSSPTLTNCTFEGNSAAYGGAMYNDWVSSPTLTNCTFSGNSATNGGGMYNDWVSSPTLTNCVLWGDSPNEISGPATVTYSDIQGENPGEGNIDADPNWVDPDNGDYHLSAESPCIDAGTNDAPYLPDYDFEGDDRVIDGDGDGTAIVDMGVDEVLPPATMHVHRIMMRARPKGPGYAVAGQVRIFDEGGMPVEGAEVYADFELPDGRTKPLSGTTVPNGWANMRSKTPMTGMHTLCVTDVVKAGMVYDPSQNLMTCGTLEILPP